MGKTINERFLDAIGYTDTVNDINREISQNPQWSPGEANAYAHARMSAELGNNIGSTASNLLGNLREAKETMKYDFGLGQDYRQDSF